MKSKNLDTVKALQTIIDTAKEQRNQFIEDFRTENAIALLGELRSAETTPQALISILDECNIVGVRFEVTGDCEKYIYLTGDIVIAFLTNGDENRETEYTHGDANIAYADDCQYVVNKQELATRKITEQEGIEVFDCMMNMRMRENKKEDFIYLLETGEDFYDWTEFPF